MKKKKEKCCINSKKYHQLGLTLVVKPLKNGNLKLKKNWAKQNLYSFSLVTKVLFSKIQKKKKTFQNFFES